MFSEMKQKGSLPGKGLIALVTCDENQVSEHTLEGWETHAKGQRSRMYQHNRKWSPKSSNMSPLYIHIDTFMSLKKQ